MTTAAAAAKSLQSYPTLWDPIDGSPPGSPVPGILQARILEWVAVSFSNAWKWKVKVKSLSRVRLLATPWTAAYQAPPPMGFPRQQYWSGMSLPSPRKIIFSEIDIYWTYGIIPKPAAFGSSTAHYPRTHSVWFMNMKYHRIMPQLKWLPLWEKNHNNGQTAMKSIHIPYQPVSVCLCTPTKCPSTCTTSVSISIRPQVVHLL